MKTDAARVFSFLKMTAGAYKCLNWLCIACKTAKPGWFDKESGLENAVDEVGYFLRLSGSDGRSWSQTSTWKPMYRVFETQRRRSTFESLIRTKSPVHDRIVRGKCKVMSIECIRQQAETDVVSTESYTYLHDCYLSSMFMDILKNDSRGIHVLKLVMHRMSDSKWKPMLHVYSHS